MFYSIYQPMYSIWWSSYKSRSELEKQAHMQVGQASYPSPKLPKKLRKVSQMAKMASYCTILTDSLK